MAARVVALPWIIIDLLVFTLIHACKYTKAPSTKKKTWRDSLSIDTLLSAMSVLVVAQSSSEIPEGLMNNPVYVYIGLLGSEGGW